MEIIGLSGYARSGKDEAANVLVDEYGFERVAFADKLRDVLYALNPLVGFEESYGDIFERYVQDVIDLYGWGGYKETEFGPEIRRLLQRLGTDAGRNVISDSIWVDAAIDQFGRDNKIVITDMRFPNEFYAVSNRGGRTWRIERAGVKPVNAHISETAIDGYPFDVVLSNDGTLDEYRETIRRTYERR